MSTSLGQRIYGRFQSATAYKLFMSNKELEVYDGVPGNIVPHVLNPANGEVTWVFTLEIDGSTYPYIFQLESNGGVGNINYQYLYDIPTSTYGYFPASKELYTNFRLGSYNNVSTSDEFDGYRITAAPSATKVNTPVITVLDDVDTPLISFEIEFPFEADRSTYPLETVPRPILTVLNPDVSVDRATVKNYFRKPGEFIGGSR